MPDSLPRSGLVTRLPAVFAVTVLLAALVGVPPARAQSDDALRRELEQLERERAALSADLGRATERLDQVTAELARVESHAAALSAEVDTLDTAAAVHSAALGQRVRALYRGAGHVDALALLAGTPAREVAARDHYLTALSRAERGNVEVTTAARQTAAARRGELEVALGEVQRLRQEAAAAAAELDRRFAVASEREQSVRGEITRREAEARRLAAEAEAKRQAEARAAAAARRSQSTTARVPRTASRSGGAPAAEGSHAGKACPQDHPRSFSDTWGAPRSGGRRHKGTDIFGARGGRVFAVTSGVVEWTRTGANSGLFLSLRGDDGHRYWYMHLQDFVAGAGQRVAAGDLIAHNGDTGNARGTSPHIHFEFHPGGGAAVNPYPMLKQVCG